MKNPFSHKKTPPPSQIRDPEHYYKAFWHTKNHSDGIALKAFIDKTSMKAAADELMGLGFSLWYVRLLRDISAINTENQEPGSPPRTMKARRRMRQWIKKHGPIKDVS